MSHTTKKTQDLIKSFGWEQFYHPPYSPDLAPSDFHLFLYLKRFLSGQRFGEDDGVKAAVQWWHRCMTKKYKNSRPAMTSASIMAETMLKNSLRYGECNENKIKFKNRVCFFYTHSVPIFRIPFVFWFILVIWTFHSIHLLITQSSIAWILHLFLISKFIENLI